MIPRLASVGSWVPLICHSPRSPFTRDLGLVVRWARAFHPDSRPAMAVIAISSSPENPAAAAARRVLRISSFLLVTLAAPTWVPPYFWRIRSMLALPMAPPKPIPRLKPPSAVAPPPPPAVWLQSTDDLIGDFRAPLDPPSHPSSDSTRPLASPSASLFRGRPVTLEKPSTPLSSMFPTSKRPPPPKREEKSPDRAPLIPWNTSMRVPATDISDSMPGTAPATDPTGSWKNPATPPATSLAIPRGLMSPTGTVPGMPTCHGSSWLAPLSSPKRPALAMIQPNSDSGPRSAARPRPCIDWPAGATMPTPAAWRRPWRAPSRKPEVICRRGLAAIMASMRLAKLGSMWAVVVPP